MQVCMSLDGEEHKKHNQSFFCMLVKLLISWRRGLIQLALGAWLNARAKKNNTGLWVYFPLVYYFDPLGSCSELLFCCRTSSQLNVYQHCWLGERPHGGEGEMLHRVGLCRLSCFWIWYTKDRSHWEQESWIPESFGASGDITLHFSVGGVCSLSQTNLCNVHKRWRSCQVSECEVTCA